MPTKISLFKMPQFETKSAFDKNFKAKASSRNPNIILNLVIQPPDFGIFFTTLGKNDKNENGNAVADGKVQKYAYGGVVSRPTLFPMANGMGLMGEAGAEAILPLRRGSNGKLGVQSTGGGATSIVVNVDASGSSVEGNDEEGRALGQLIATAIQSQLVKEKLPGGLLA